MPKRKVFTEDNVLVYRVSAGKYEKVDISQIAGTAFAALVTKVGAVEALADVTDQANVLAAITTSGSGAPGTTPAAIGLFYVDTAAGKLYFSKGIASSADWVLVTSA